jgi:hypothetical protein
MWGSLAWALPPPPSFSSSGCASFTSVSIRCDTAVAGAAQCHRRLCCWLLSRAHCLRQTKAFGARRGYTALINAGADLLQFVNTPRRALAEVDYSVNGISEAGQLILSGTVKAYAIATVERHPALPDIPTTVEAGLPEYLAIAWFALFAPNGVPQSILDKLTDALDQALDDGNVRRRLIDIGGNIPPKSKRGPQPLAALVKSKIARWTPIIKAANVRLD